mmetsp:Transcript_20753/g.45188  ORF Transcript_20753/g.45188 Transcript_20753/m.45188 type:complete len:101 (+) Transcript_20753:938-1240(+)
MGCDNFSQPQFIEKHAVMLCWKKLFHSDAFTGIQIERNKITEIIGSSRHENQTKHHCCRIRNDIVVLVVIGVIRTCLAIEQALNRNTPLTNIKNNSNEQL